MATGEVGGGHMRMSSDVGVKIGLKTAHINQFENGFGGGSSTSHGVRTTKASKKAVLMYTSKDQ